MSNRHDHYFPFEKLGLRSNPFRTLTHEEWANIAIIPPEIEAAFDNGDNLLLLGKRGRGKSTLLRSLIRRVAWQDKQTAYERLAFGQWHYQTNITELDAFAPDEAQRLALWEWPQLLYRARRGMRLIIGSHRNDNWLLQLAGIPITVFELKAMNTRQHLAHILQQRVEYFALHKQAYITFDDSAIDYLWQQYGDNLRGVEHYLYDVFQQLNTPGPITSDLLMRRRL